MSNAKCSFAIALALFALRLLGSALPASGQGLQEVLEHAFLLQADLLDSEYERYDESRQREDQDIARVRELSRQIDDALADQRVSVGELREKEAELTAAREVALARARESADLRWSIYDRMDTLVEIGRHLEAAKNRALVKSDQLSGRWRFEATTAPARNTAAGLSPRIEEFGVLDLHFDGTVVTGTYRLSSGSQGSLQGTFADSRVELVRVDATSGQDLTLEGILDPEIGLISGTWQSKELAVGGAPGTPSRGWAGAGEWTAHKFAHERP